MKKDILLKVTLEYDSGKVVELNGDEANDWLEQVNSAVMISAMHGVSLSHFNWKVVKEN